MGESASDQQCDYYGADLAAANGHLKVLEWLYSKDVFCTFWGVNRAKNNKQLNVLQWLASPDRREQQIYFVLDQICLHCAH